MARLTYAQRQALPDSAFALPATREYPIEDIRHGRNALARVSAYGSASEKARVRAAVHRRYPSIGNPRVRLTGGVLAIGAGAVAFALVSLHIIDLSNVSFLHSLASSAGAPLASSANTPAPNVSPTISSQGWCGGQRTGDQAAMIAANPNIVAMIQAWQSGGWQQQLNPPAQSAYDWPSFESYLVRLGYPDPGANPPLSFCGM